MRRLQPSTGARPTRRKALRCGLGALAGLALGPQLARAARPFPDDGSLDFLVLRFDTVVGRHRIDIARRDGVMVVRSDVEILVGPSGAPRYRYVHRSEEGWTDGWLSALVSDTDDNGALWRVRAERDRRGIFSGLVNGLAFSVSGYAITTSLWHRDTPSQQALLDAVDGRVKLVRGFLIGEEDVTAGSRRVPAKHYSLRGGLRREVWYDADCNLVRAARFAGDGSVLWLELS